ncbi:proline dehydrogenase [Roseovarius sp. MBR-51]|jgi:proline dehydrogenase
MSKAEFRKNLSDVSETTRLNAAMGLRRLAANPVVRERFSGDAAIRNLFASPVSRYIVGGSIEEAAENFNVLNGKGYLIGAEHVGEEISDAVQVERVVEENIRFLKAAREHPFSEGLQLGFDLSSVGMLISRELAAENTAKIAEVAATQGATIMISMERTSHTDQILDIFKSLAASHKNLGITIQAYLKRTIGDLPDLIMTGRRIRLVKGVYDEHPTLALPRGSALDDQYMEIAAKLASSSTHFSIATHDSRLIQRLREEGLLEKALEVDALHGCNPDLQRALKDEGITSRVTGVYGEEWLLHFLHRLAEHTPNLLEAFADFYDPSRVVFGARY